MRGERKGRRESEGDRERESYLSACFFGSVSDDGFIIAVYSVSFGR